MIINWPLIILLFVLAAPGIVIAIPRLIRILIPQASPDISKRISILAMIQSFFLTFIMCIGGAVISQKTGLKAPVLEAMLHGQPFIEQLQNILLPSLLFALLAFVLFAFLFYMVCASLIDDKSFQILRTIHQQLGLDGALLYGGVLEEIIARWGMFNALVFFCLIFVRDPQHNGVLWIAAVISACVYAFSQLPAYFAAGCIKSRQFIYCFLALHLCTSMIFAYVFWQYGLVAAIFSHMLFHAAWYFYDQPKNAE